MSKKDEINILRCIDKITVKVGIPLLSSVLKGSENSSTMRPEMRSNPYFGVLDKYDLEDIRRMIDDAISYGHLEIYEIDTINPKSKIRLLRLTKDGKNLIENELKSESTDTGKPSTGIQSTTAKDCVNLSESEQKSVPKVHNIIYSKLREFRAKKAKDEKLPPYVIFNDVTLTKLAIFLPKSITEFNNIWGMGPKRTEKYGPEILLIIKDNRDAKDFVKSDISDNDTIVKVRNEYVKNLSDLSPEDAHHSVHHHPEMKRQLESRYFRQRVFDFRGRKCELCGSMTGLQIHHRTNEIILPQTIRRTSSPQIIGKNRMQCNLYFTEDQKWILIENRYLDIFMKNIENVCVLCGTCYYNSSGLKIRYPNAFEPWKTEQDNKLIELFNNNTPLDEISKVLQRTPWAILCRLEKLNLIE